MNLPSPTQCLVENESSSKASFVLEPFYPGYGTTVGNALRRVLLSSLEGTAISGVSVKGVNHEFSTLPGVKEDFVDIVLNLKGIVVKAEDFVDLSSLRLKLAAKGERVITAGEVDLPTGVEIMNPEHVLFTLTSSSSTIEMEFALSRGRGFLPIESREHEDRELGFIAIDSLFSPVTKVGFTVEDVRVGQMTNYDKVTLEVETNGIITPSEAVKKSLSILVDQFTNVLTLVNDSSEENTNRTNEGDGDGESDPAQLEAVVQEDGERLEEVSDDANADEKPKKKGRKKKEE